MPKSGHLQVAQSAAWSLVGSYLGGAVGGGGGTRWERQDLGVYFSEGRRAPFALWSSFIKTLDEEVHEC